MKKGGKNRLWPDFCHADGTEKSREEFAFLKEVDSIALQQSLRDLDRGFVNFFSKERPIQLSKANITIFSRTER